MKSTFSVEPAVRSTVRLTLALVLCLWALPATPASAQLSVVGGSKPLFGTGGILIGNDVSYDPRHGVYLVVAGYGEQYGIFVNQAGDAVSGAFRIGSANSGAAFGHYPRSEYSEHVNGGQGGFLVTWHQVDGNQLGLHSVVVAYPAGIISPERLINDYGAGQTRPGAGTGIAYSPASRRFMVAWTTGGGAPFGIQGRLLDTTGAPIGPVMQLANPFGSADPAVAWNPATDEFAVFHVGFTDTAAYVTLKRLRAADGVFQGVPTKFGFAGGAFSTEIAVNTATNHYVVGWSTAPGSLGAELDESGTLLSGPGLISSLIGTPTSLSIAYNPVSGTFLAVSEGVTGKEVLGVELTSTGVPKTAAVTATSGARTGAFVPRVTARTDAKEWNISYARDMTVITNQVIATAADAGGLPPVPRASAKPDITIWRPSTGTWYQMTLGASGWTAGAPIRWGFETDRPVRADFDGDRQPDLVNYGASEGRWSVLFSSKQFSYDFAVDYTWGAPGDIPVPADYSGDGRTELAIWRPSNGTWYIFDLATGTFTSRQWGLNGDVPITGDFDRDGKADIGVYRPSSGYWFVIFSSTQTYTVYQWGISTDVPVAADYTGDGRTELAVYRPSTGYWYIYNLATSTYTSHSFGFRTDLPVPRDYDGDGRTDLGLWRPSTGTWYTYSLATGAFQAVTHGGPGDMPLR